MDKAVVRPPRSPYVPRVAALLKLLVDKERTEAVGKRSAEAPDRPSAAACGIEQLATPS